MGHLTMYNSMHKHPKLGEPLKRALNEGPMIRLRPGTSVFEILQDKFPSQWDARVHMVIIVVLMMMVKKGCCIGYDEVYVCHAFYSELSARGAKQDAR